MTTRLADRLIVGVLLAASIAAAAFDLRTSIGAVQAGAGRDTPDAVVDVADEALYEAKRTGRSRVCVS